MISVKIISDSTISFIRTFVMDFFYHLGDSFIFGFIERDLPVQPFVIRSSAYFSKLAKCNNWITMLRMFFFNGLINMFISQQAQPRLLSISSSFFKKDASISACIRFALSNFNSAFSFSTSERVSSGLRLPRLSCSPTIPLSSYLIV